MGYITERIPIIFQIAVAVGLFSMAYQHVLKGEIKFPKVNTIEKRVIFAIRCLTVSVIPLIIAWNNVGEFNISQLV